MRSKKLFFFIITVLLAIYYLYCGIYLNRLGYSNAESLFYIEKAKIILEGIGNRIKVMGLTSPLLPFYGTFIFSAVGAGTLAPVIASGIGTALLFYIMARTLLRYTQSFFYVILLVLLFVFHPGILYVACSGKGIYLSLIFFLLFFLNILKFYRSNTTFHISIASICLVILVFCDYKFIWLSLFFIPLVLSIAIQSLNLSEKESIFRLFLSFNSPSLRRKLFSKTFALYVILFILPIASIVCYKLLNLTHANDMNYFLESPYATWNVLQDKLEYDQLSVSTYSFLPQEVSLLISVKAIIFCPMILVAIYLFRDSTYQILTILTPFAFIEFLHIKYDKLFLNYEYFMIFIILAYLCIMFKVHDAKGQFFIKVLLSVLFVVQVFTGYYFLKNSNVSDEKNFYTALRDRKDNFSQQQNLDAADAMNNLPTDGKVLVDDAIAYPVVAYAKNMQQLTMPYQDEFAGALESPEKYVDYLLIATARNRNTGYTQMNNKYIDLVKLNDDHLRLRIIFENTNWVVYQIISR
ncbi:MAG: hypothetical protein ACTHNW_03130 [Mucilaginibacter sp.]